MRQLWNELVAMHERTPYRLLRSVERTFHAIAKKAMEEAGQAREKGLTKEAEARDLEAEAHRTRADELKETAKTVMKQSYQGFNPEQFNASTAKVKQLKEGAKAAKMAGDLKRAALLSDNAENLRAQALAPLRLRLTLDRLIDIANRAVVSGDTQVELEARTRLYEICADERLWQVASIPFEERVKYHVQERGRDLNLPVWCKWHVGETFKNAMTAYAKRQRFAPRYKADLETVHIQQRTESGSGWSIDQIFKRRKPFSIRPETVNGGVYDGWKAPGWFSINGERVPINVTMHRPYPDGAIIKRYSLIGSHEKSDDSWEWKILFQLEIPPSNILRPATGRAISIDAGWRSFRQRAFMPDGIRVLTVYDGHNVWELFIPFDLTNAELSRQLRRDEKRRDRPAKRSLPDRIDIRQTWKIQSERDAKREECKESLESIDTANWPEKARKQLSTLKKMRGEGLRMLHKTLQNAGITCEILETWLAFDGPVWKRQRYIQKKWIARRNEIYRVWAAEIAESCDTVIWEGNLNLKRIAEEPARKKESRKAKYAKEGRWEHRTEEQRLAEAAAKWRTLVSLSWFRLGIREAMAKQRREVIDDETAHSSRICSECWGEIEPSSDLIVTCKHCGAQYDQDINTVYYYWDRLTGDTQEAAEPLPSVKRSLLERCWRQISG